jgi:hypothetical protein
VSIPLRERRVYSYLGSNYFAVAEIVGLAAGDSLYADAAGMTVQQAYAIDAKMDDGLPQSGGVLARYVNNDLYGSGPIWATGVSHGQGPADGTVATPASDTTCYDNYNQANTQQHYSTQWKSGSGLNCGLSFNF